MELFKKYKSKLKSAYARILFRRSAFHDDVKLIVASGVFDINWYLASNPDVQHDGANAIEHYYLYGAFEGRNPCYLFESEWYLQHSPDVAASGLNPLVHYLRYGESEGRPPSPYFNPAFYEAQLPRGENPRLLLGHYLQHGCRHYCPNSFFDTSYYLKVIAEERIRGLPPLAHYLSIGWAEGREINPIYSFSLYRQQLEYRLAQPTEPLRFYLEHGSRDGDNLPRRGKSLRLVTESLQQALNKSQTPGAHYEDELLGGGTAPRLPISVRVFAFYLPQFYPFPENDKWWGKGFTEWRNVARALPRYQGHQQPRIPRDLGFYDLRNITTIRSQVEMAKRSGLTGFCYYYYWFNGKRLLDQPLDLFLQDKTLDFQFSLMWANENWTRRWDGLENDVLMQQDYRQSDDEALVADLARYFTDPRYEHIDGRPLFVIYRPGIIPHFKRRVSAWRRLFKSNHSLEPIIFMALGFGDYDPTVYGLDGAIEFPPHKLAEGLATINDELDIIDPEFGGHYIRYDDLVTSSLATPTPDFELIKTLIPAWDNEARKPGRGSGFAEATPAKYENWLRQLVLRAEQNPLMGKASYVFVNAWNEWAEGAHLEPDLHNGVAYLNSTYRALTGLRKSQWSGTGILLVGHDAYRHGAQLLLLSIMKTLRQEFGVRVFLLLLQGGPLVDEYSELGEVIVASESALTLPDLLDELAVKLPTKQAICNTVVTGSVVELLSRRGFEIVSLIHELSQLIKERKLETSALAAALHADKLLFAAEFVRDSFTHVTGAPRGESIVRPQGIYQAVKYQPEARNYLKRRLKLAPESRIVVNLGFGDLRKGFDLFVALAKLVVARDPAYHFVWVGGIQHELEHWLTLDVSSLPLKEHFHTLPFDPDVAQYLNGADAFALTSREDPFPSVVLEALACGLPVVGFVGGGGYVQAINLHPINGAVVPMSDTVAMADSLIATVENDSLDTRQRRASLALDRYDWKDYVFTLLKLLSPDLKKVSVILPNYNYARYLPQRLESIFCQDYPIYELIILDDGSTDESIAVIHESLRIAGRRATVICNEANTGSVFGQWERGAQLSSGEIAWIAEADDLSTSNFLTDLISRWRPDITIGFCDSSQIDSTGKTLGDSYHFYYQDLPSDPLSGDLISNGRDFVATTLSIKNVILNASGVLFNRNDLLEAFAQCGKKIRSFQVAGDWYLYCTLLARESAHVLYSSQANNIHRRHAISVTRQLNFDRHLEEIRDVQQYAAEIAPQRPSARDAAAAYLDEVTEQLTPLH